MNFKTTLILLALLAVVGGYWVAFERGKPVRQPGASERRGGHALFDNPPAVSEFHRITIKREDETAAIERTTSGWSQLEPVRFPLQPAAIETLLKQLVELRYLERFTIDNQQTPTLAEMELASPRAKLTASSESGTMTLKLGRTIGGDAYLMRTDETIAYIVPRSFHDHILENKVRDWRIRQLSAPSASSAGRVTLKRRQQRIELNKREGRWYLGPNERASRRAVQALANAVRRASVQSFVADAPDDPALYGLDQPRLTIRLYPAGAAPGNADNAKPTTTLTIGAAADGGLNKAASAYFAMWQRGNVGQGAVFKLDAQTVEALEQSPADLRDPHLVTVQAEEVSRLQVHRPDATDIDVTRDALKGFRFGNPDPDFAPDTATLNKLIETITSIKATDYVTGESPQRPALMTITITHRGTGESERVRLYPANDRKEPTTNEAADQSQASQAASPTKPAAYLAVRNDEPVAYRVPMKKFALLSQPILALRDKSVIDVAPNDLKQVSLRRDDGTTFTFTRSSADQNSAENRSATKTTEGTSGWQLNGHAQFERSAFLALLRAMPSLRVKRWLHDASEPSGNAIELTWRTATGKTRTLRAAPDTGRATLSAIEPAFVLPKSFLDRLKAEYRTRAALPIKSSAIKHIDVIEPRTDDAPSLDTLRQQLSNYDPSTSADSALRLRRDASGRFVSNVSKPVDQSAAGALFDRLAGLAVKRYTTPRENRAVARRFRVTTDANETFELILFADGGAYLHGETPGRLPAPAFTLPDQTRRALTRALLQAQ